MTSTNRGVVMVTRENTAAQHKWAMMSEARLSAGEPSWCTSTVLVRAKGGDAPPDSSR